MYLEILAEETKNVLHLAYYEARRTKATFSAEHVLLTLLRESTGKTLHTEWWSPQFKTCWLL